jgi:hypothetical protein
VNADLSDSNDLPYTIVYLSLYSLIDDIWLVLRIACACHFGIACEEGKNPLSSVMISIALDGGSKHR